MDFGIGCELVHHSVTMVQILRAVGLMAAIIADEKPVQFFPTFAKDSAPKRMAFNMRITSISATAQQVFSFLQSLWLVGDMPTLRKDGLLRIGQSR